MGCLNRVPQGLVLSACFLMPVWILWEESSDNLGVLSLLVWCHHHHHINHNLGCRGNAPDVLFGAWRLWECGWHRTGWSRIDLFIKVHINTDIKGRHNLWRIRLAIWESICIPGFCLSSGWKGDREDFSQLGLVHHLQPCPVRTVWLSHPHGHPAGSLLYIQLFQQLKTLGLSACKPSHWKAWKCK